MESEGAPPGGQELVPLSSRDDPGQEVVPLSSRDDPGQEVVPLSSRDDPGQELVPLSSRDDPHPERRREADDPHLERRREAEPLGRFSIRWILIIVLALLSFALFISVIVLAVQTQECPSADREPCPPAGLACPDMWVGFRGKCYYFSGEERDWASSRTRCSALNASLAVIDTPQDMNFLVRYKTTDHWIGLSRDPWQPWKWANGTEFNNWFPIEEEGGDCAYLNEQGRVRTLECTSMRYSICTKPDVCTEVKRTNHTSIGV